MGLPYSGQYGFTETYMYWPTTHMVQSADKALQCDSCHRRSELAAWIGKLSATLVIPSNGAEENKHETIHTLLTCWTSHPGSCHWNWTRFSPRPNLLLHQQASVLHPNFVLLDADGVNVLESSNAVSTMQTCGQCHDTEFIQTHAFHSDLGLAITMKRKDLNTSTGTIRRMGSAHLSLPLPERRRTP